MIISGSLECSNKFKILKGMREEASEIQTLDFRQAELGLFGELVGMIPWEAAPKGTVAYKSLQVFKDPPSTRAVCLDMQENEQIYEEPSLTKQKAHGGGPNIKRQYIRGGSRERLQKRNLEILPECTVSGKSKLSWSWDFQGMSKATRKASFVTLVIKGWPWKMCDRCWVVWVIQWQQRHIKSEVLKVAFVSVCANNVFHTSVILEHVQEEPASNGQGLR